jgi:hypothetical protein
MGKGTPASRARFSGGTRCDTWQRLVQCDMILRKGKVTMRRRDTTKTNGVDHAPDEHLTPQHLAAIDLLVSGQTLTQTAAALGVGRPAVSEWVNHRADFQAAMNKRRQELWESVVESLRGLLPQALAVLQEELKGQGPGRLTAAIHVFKCVGLYGQVGAPTGPATVEDVEQAQRRQALERARTVLTAEDLTLAQQRREADRTLAALTALPFGGPLPGPRPSKSPGLKRGD